VRAELKLKVTNLRKTNKDQEAQFSNASQKVYRVRKLAEKVQRAMVKKQYGLQNGTIELIQDRERDLQKMAIKIQDILVQQEIYRG